MARLTMFWFRRDLRLEDNAGLFHALSQNENVQPLFIFDTTILDRLPRSDARVQFLQDEISRLKEQMREHGSDLWVFHGKPVDVWKTLLSKHDVVAVYANSDNEPAAIERDAAIEKLLKSKGAAFHSFKDQSLFDRDEILTGGGTPYTVFTPYKNKVLATLTDSHLKTFPVARVQKNLHATKAKTPMPSLEDLGFTPSPVEIPDRRVVKSVIETYDKTRDFPALEKGTTHLGMHLRFGTVSPRKLAALGRDLNGTWLSELIWRDFFMQILWHFPHVQKQSFRPQYDKVEWRTSKRDLERWKEGLTGYPLVDAGMRELNATGFMHNRSRMVTAQFLTKNLLIYWLEGERYFAEKLLDYDLASNNGNWQWAAGTGCDAAPYFRIFNPMTQAKRFDRDETYVRRWIPEYGTAKYPAPMIDHNEARGRALAAFTKALKGKSP